MLILYNMCEGTKSPSQWLSQ